MKILSPLRRQIWRLATGILLGGACHGKTPETAYFAIELRYEKNCPPSLTSIWTRVPVQELFLAS